MKNTSSALPLVFTLSVVLLAGCSSSDGDAPEDVPEAREEPLECSVDNNLDLFQERIEPLIGPDRKPSCSRCHLPGTDFQEYVFEGDACRTMACLAQSGLVDLETPEESKMLGWILRGSEEAESRLIDDDVVHTEYEAFRQWIEFSSQCGVEFCGDIPNPCGFENSTPDPEEPDPDDPDAPDEPEEIPDLTVEGYGCEDSDLELAFFDHVYEPWRGRCAHCHTEDPPTRSPGPVWVSDDRTLVGSTETLETILERGYFDLEQPEMSLWLLKPLSVDEGGIEHGGGTKILKDDDMYIATVDWVTLHQSCQSPQ